MSDGTTATGNGMVAVVDAVGDVVALAVSDRVMVGRESDVVLLFLSTVWDPCDRDGVIVGRDGDRVAKDTVEVSDADGDVDAERVANVSDSVRRDPVFDED